MSTTEFVSREERDEMIKLGMEDGINQCDAALDKVPASQR